LPQSGHPAGLRFFCFGAVALLLAAAAAWGHDFWIEPTRFTPAPGERVGVGLWSGDRFAGDPVPRSADRMARFSILTPAGEVPVQGVDGVHPAGFYTPPAAGAYWIVFESRPRILTLPAERFERYLREEGLERIIELRRGLSQSEAAGRESYRRCAKSLVEVGAHGAASGGEIAGCPLELVLETSPPAAAATGRVKLRLLFEGRPLAGARVAVLRRGAPGAALESRTDAAGRASFPLTGEEVWLIKTVHMEPAPATSIGVDWQSWWASLTVRLPAAGLPAAPGGGRLRRSPTVE
jgi:uncharacterized GH25 family protein